VLTRSTLLAPLLLLPFAACHANDPAAVTLPSFQDLPTAPPAIQQAAKAVVRIHTAGEWATGSFISATGLLLTNNHVLGIGICLTEGCDVQLVFDYERGETSTTKVVFVKPVAVNVGLDMAIVQAFDSAGGSELSTPSYLTIQSRDPASLVGTHVTIVGHPLGDLKKWTSGDVYETDGDWINTTAYILPGNSGSPVLDDTGKLVAIIHRSPTSQDLFSSVGVDTYSIGTASASLLAAETAPLPPEMISTGAKTTDLALVASDLPYLNGDVATARLESGGTASVLDALGAACDAALAVSDYATPEDLATALQPCVDATLWIECRSDVTPALDGTVCPDDTAAWARRFQGMNSAYAALNDQLWLSPVSFGIASLASTHADGVAAAASSLVKALNAVSAPLDPYAAIYLAAFAVDSYDGQSIESYVTDYTAIPAYAINADDLADAAYWLGEAGTLSQTAANQILVDLASDPTVDLGTKLDIEALQYGWGVID
jgi:V8-like Glu-specific endopeptidase